MSVKYITDLEIVASEENITGEENVLMVQDGTAKLVPMNMIKGSGGSGGALVIDLSEAITIGNTLDVTDVQYGDTIKEAIQNGELVYVYRNDTYSIVLYAYVYTNTNLSKTDAGYQKLVLTCYTTGTSGGLGLNVINLYLTYTE